MTTPQAGGHTPGPWIVDDDCVLAEVADGPGHGTFTVCHVAPAPFLNGGTPEANARLIASAPELLRSRDELAKALRSCRDLLKSYLNDSGGCDHSVGICACAEIQALEDADAALGGLAR